MFQWKTLLVEQFFWPDIYKITRSSCLTMANTNHNYQAFRLYKKKKQFPA